MGNLDDGMIRELEILLESYRASGARHPIKIYSSLPPEHPYTKLLIKEVEALLQFKKREITADEYLKIREETDIKKKEIEKQLEKEISRKL